MALYDAVVGAIADVVAGALNVGLRAMGYSEVEAKRIESTVFWALFGSFAAFLVWLTSRFS